MHVLMIMVSHRYTNVAVLDTYVSLVGGEVLRDRELRDYGMQRLQVRM